MSTVGGAPQLNVPLVRFNEFLPDRQRIGEGVIVGQTGCEMLLENNKQAFALDFVQRQRFMAAYLQTSYTPSQFQFVVLERRGNAFGNRKSESNQ